MARISSTFKANELKRALANAKLRVKEQQGKSNKKAVITKLKKSIARFKLGTGMPLGGSVTLRGDRMFEFLDRFINAVLPRVRDFRGISPRAFDGRGNYTIGIKDQLIFPEIDFNKVDRTRGLNVSIVTTARTDEEGRALLREFGMPFTK